jgi:acyl carrier protein
VTDILEPAPDVASLEPVRAEVLDVLAAAVSEHLDVVADVHGVEPATPLGALSFGGLGIDSMDLLVLVLAVEEHFDCDFDDAALCFNPTWGVFVGTIADQVRSIRQERSNDG